MEKKSLEQYISLPPPPQTVTEKKHPTPPQR
jgi:hypothetical protein